MATAKLNPVILSISGRFGNSVFYVSRNRQCVRSYVVPRNPDTLLQKEVRKNFAEAVKSWQRISPEEKYAYARKARGLGMSGYNLYISEFMAGKKAARKKYKISGAVSIFQENMTSPGHIHSVSLPYVLLCEASKQYCGTKFGEKRIS
ncbi:MAG: hypothetical protein JW864_16500 [Spirochaetes bacterium]|nr:hypothetical protein [Spirochaetota bacterium]